MDAGSRGPSISLPVPWPQGRTVRRLVLKLSCRSATYSCLRITLNQLQGVYVTANSDKETPLYLTRNKAESMDGTV